MATYGSETGVEAINAHLVGGYTTTSVPTSTQVATYLSDGYSAINARLAMAGYSTPVAATVACYDAIARLNNLFAAASAEEATNISSAGPEGESRSQRLWARYETEFTSLLGGDLTQAGLSKAATAPVRKRVRSVELRRRDGYAHRFDSDNTEYAAGSTDDITLREPWRLSSEYDSTVDDAR
jgi:hypothetical protein